MEESGRRSSQLQRENALLMVVDMQEPFLRAIWDGTPTTPSIADGLHIQEVMEAAVRSSEENRWVNVVR